MKTKINILIVALYICGFSAHAQSDGVSFGLRAGVDMQNFNGKDHNGDQLKMSAVPRYHVGFTVDVPIAPDFYFQPALLYTTKGAESNNEFLGIDMDANYNLGYIGLPLNLLYKPYLGTGRIILGFGPYLAYGINGKVNYNIGNISSEEKIDFTSENTSSNPMDRKYFNAFDYGGNLILGYELANGFSFQLNTLLGLAKINRENPSLSFTDTEIRNTGYGLSLGYKF